MKKAIDIITTVGLVIVLVLAFLLAGIRIFGLKPYTVLSGSMEPEYHVGSLIYVKDVTMADLKVNDPITYTIGNGTVVTHRIIEIKVNPDNLTSVSYVTKGDANETADGTPVPYENVIGKPVFTVPLLGYVSYYIHTPSGLLLVAALIVILVSLMFIPDMLRKALATDEPSEGKGADDTMSDVKELINDLKTDGKDNTEKKE